MEIQLFFIFSILPPIALKLWNFPDNEDFKGNIITKLLLRSHFSLIWNNVTIKYVTCIMAFFIPSTLVTACQFNSITSPVLFTKSNKLWNLWKRRFSVYMTASLSVIWKEVENCIFRHNYIFRHTLMYKHPILTEQWMSYLMTYSINNLGLPSRHRTGLLDVSWTSYVRLIYVLCLLGHVLSTSKNFVFSDFRKKMLL